MYSDILRYMGHKGDADTRLINMISLCINKIDAESEPRYAKKFLPCKVSDDKVMIDTLVINSRALASHLLNCEHAYVFAATLGASVDRLIARVSVTDTLEALCLQACAAFKIENYCSDIERELACNINSQDLRITQRFSPGYADFDIAHQSDILRLLNAQKYPGVTVTKTHMLSPLKSVTAIVGLSTYKVCGQTLNKCTNCEKTDCQFRAEKGTVNE